MKYAVLFPGQGSQFVGMGAGLFDSRGDLLGKRADDVLGFSLKDVCLNGPEEKLTRTEHAQPALFALSYALWDELSSRAPKPAAAAGHSLGEYTALAAAGVFSFDVALRVVAERGLAMADAADTEQSTRAAVIGADLAAVESICADRRAADGRIWVANINSPGQIVVAGSVPDVSWLEAEARSLGLRRVVPLAVAGAFHSPFMAPAAARLRAELEPIKPADTDFDVYANTTAAPVSAPDVVESLVSQVVAPVRFSETLQAMAATGIDTFVHVGPGDVTAGLVKRTVKGATVFVVSSLEDVPEVGEALSTMQ